MVTIRTCTQQPNYATTVLYGGVASAIGYFKLLSAPPLQEDVFLSKTWFMGALLVLVYLMFKRLYCLFGTTAFSVVIACIISAIAINPQTKLSSAASAAIFDLLLLVLGIIYFTSTTLGPWNQSC